MFLLSLSICYTWENIKSHTKAIDLKYPDQCGMKNLNYQVNHIFCIKCLRQFSVHYQKT